VTQPGRVLSQLGHSNLQIRTGGIMAIPCFVPSHLAPPWRGSLWEWSPEWGRSGLGAGYEQHCLGTANSGRSYARRAHASRSRPRSWMSPSLGSILGEQGQQPTDQCRLYARLHRTGAQSTWRNSVFDTDARSPML